MKVTTHKEVGFTYKMIYSDAAEEHYVKIDSEEELFHYMKWAEVIEEEDVSEFVGKWFIVERGSMIEVQDEVVQYVTQQIMHKHSKKNEGAGGMVTRLKISSEIDKVLQ